MLKCNIDFYKDGFSVDLFQWRVQDWLADLCSVAVLEKHFDSLFWCCLFYPLLAMDLTPEKLGL